MHHQVTFIGEGDLPKGHDWALFHDPVDDRFHLFVNPAAITPDLLMECWSEFTDMAKSPLALPAPRRPQEFASRLVRA